MQTSTIKLTYNKGNNEFIDYLKGLSIVSVILTHSLYPIKDDFLFNLWGMQAVPLFLIISSALFFRKGVPTEISLHLDKLFTRIIIPYLVFSLILASVSIAVGKDTFSSAIETLLHDAGMGPGSYYVPLYVQCFILLPFFALIVRKTKYPFFITMGISITLEILANHYLPMWIYRLSIIRYLPLLYAGYYWTAQGIKLNSHTLFLSIISIVAILILTYWRGHFNPFFCTFHPWEYANWICYAYPAILLPFLLHMLFTRISVPIRNIFQRLGRDSFEIYMMQMAVFYFFPIEYFQEHLANFSPIYVYGICTLCTMTASIVPVILYKCVKTRMAS